MSLKNCLRNIICISILFSASVDAQILFTPFKNNADYKGKWDLSIEVPNYIAAYFREFHSQQVLSSTTYSSLAEKYGPALTDIEFISEIGKEKGFKYAVLGTINEFKIARFTAGDPLLAGYEAYTCEIEASFKIYNLQTNGLEYTGTIKSDLGDKGVGLNLLGKPSDEKKQFYSLDNMKFGGEEFSKTIVGETMMNFCENLSEDILKTSKTILKPNRNIITEIADKSLDDITLNAEVMKGTILVYDSSTGEAFLNLGSLNKLKIGEELSVYSPADSLFDPTTNEFLGVSDKKISTLEIIEIRGEKLSLAIVKENRDDVQKGMEVRKTVIKREE